MKGICRPNTYNVKGKCVEILLKGGSVCVIDYEDIPKIFHKRWHVIKDRTKIYCSSNHKVNGKKTTIKIARFLIDCPANMVIDHIDGDGLNNRKSNLRICSQRHNSMSKRKLGFFSSKYKGVTFNKFHGRWASQINAKGKIRHLGYFISEVEAAEAYNKSAIKYFGEFAKLNTIKGENNGRDYTTRSC